jgi:predicted transcriptional regulator
MGFVEEDGFAVSDSDGTVALTEQLDSRLRRGSRIASLLANNVMGSDIGRLPKAHILFTQNMKRRRGTKDICFVIECSNIIPLSMNTRND